MTAPPLRLHHGDMVRALEAINLLDVLVRPLTGVPDSPGPSQFVPDGTAMATTGLTTVRDIWTRRVYLLPTPSLNMICLAGLAGLAARELLPPGVVTAGVIGSGATAQLHLEVIARYVPNVSHAAVYPPPAEGERPVESNIREQLERAGIAVSIKTSPQGVVAGANLLVIAELGWDRLDIGRLPPGMLVINASRRDIPDELLADVDLIYVDDLGLLEHNQHRKFVRTHLIGPNTEPGRTHRNREGWYRRRRRLWRDQQRIESDLGHVVVDRHRRMDVDDLVLVELLGGPALDIWLAGHICQAAIRLGLGC
jgi:ornithine cyclodeaminase/alanine dehydrogenase-like protein (mu-crystallin family)